MKAHHRYKTKQECIVHYEKEADVYDLSRTLSPSGHRQTQVEVRQLARYLPDSSGARVLEVGCGTGRLLHLLNRRGAQFYGLDSSERMLRRCMEKVCASCGQVYVVQGDAEMLPFRDASFDVTYTINVIQWLPDPRPTIAEMYRVTRPGGIVIVDIANRDSLWRRTASVIRRRVPPYHTFSLRDISELLRGYSYSVVRYLSYSPTLYRLPMLGRIIPILERWLPLPLHLSSKWLCIIRKG